MLSHALLHRSCLRRPARLLVVLSLAALAAACGGGDGAAPAGPGGDPGPGSPQTTAQIGGTLSGLGAGKSLVAANADASGTTLQSMTFTANGTYSMTVPLGTAYNVRILTHPAGQGCDVLNGTGTANADVVNIGIVCADEFAPSAPAGLTVTYSAKSFVFSWNATAGARFYKLLEDPDGVSGFSEVASSIAATTHTHAISVTRRLSATYALQACNFGGGCGAVSATLAPQPARATGYLKAQASAADIQFGTALAVSADGDTVAVAAPGQSFPTEVAGAVTVFHRTAEGWRTQATLAPTATPDSFGYSVSLSGDGNILAVGARFDDGADGTVINSGATYIFVRNGDEWTQQAVLRASNPGGAPNAFSPGDAFGSTVSLSADGTTLAVGARGEASDGSGPENNAAAFSGAVYVFVRSGSAWTEQAYLKGSGIAAWRLLGEAVALSADGNTLAAGASGATAPGPVSMAGAVHVFTRTGAAWSEQQVFRASNPGLFDSFGAKVSLSADGNTLAAGATGESSNGTSPGNRSAASAGAAYVFTRSAGVWTEQAYLKKPSPAVSESFGGSISLSGDGSLLAIGATGEGSNALGIDGTRTGTTASSGAAFLYRRSAGAWGLAHYLKPPVVAAQDAYGSAVGLSHDGGTLAVGAFLEDSAATGIGGDQEDNTRAASGAAYLY